MNPPEFNASEVAPKNRAQVWFRALLWLMPTGFAWSSFIGLVLLHSRIRVPDWGLGVLLLVNLIFVAGAGWFDGLLARHVRGSGDRMTAWTLIFCGCQLIVIPALSLLVGFVIGAVLYLIR